MGTACAAPTVPTDEPKPRSVSLRGALRQSLKKYFYSLSATLSARNMSYYAAKTFGLTAKFEETTGESAATKLHRDLETADVSGSGHTYVRTDRERDLRPNFNCLDKRHILRNKPWQVFWNSASIAGNKKTFDLEGKRRGRLGAGGGARDGPLASHTFGLLLHFCSRGCSYRSTIIEN
ncbi:hypothetical protein EVAR_103728_1 [Eumeta japonica]|uniref:Uncharacterized protein n=1 Tax=Eumeta variegata TaxID=151549 RepID=A0A4C1ZHM2_EUMVA|nr:hypothetical protein EVAR_103728_1 [Eumeta japonica]